MRDKIELLVEETGALAREAELALGLSGYDVEQALKILHGRMRDVFVVKVKFLSQYPNMYGLALFIANVTGAASCPSFRLRCVFSENPYLYETDLGIHWYEFEKAIYRARLSELCHVGVSQSLEQEWEDKIGGESSRLIAIRESLVAGRQDGVDLWLEELVRASRAWRIPPKYAYETDVLSLKEYRQSPATLSGRAPYSPFFFNSAPAADKGEIFLNLRIALESASGPRQTPGSTSSRLAAVRAVELAAGDVTSVYVLESRDTGLYLAEVFGGYADNGLYPIEAPVESVWREGELAGVRVRFGHSVVGEATFPPDLRVWALRRTGPKPGLLRRLLDW
ncbi:MAG: hypothetical protein AAB091_00650 [Elusimicrobiota bacterium]